MCRNEEMILSIQVIVFGDVHVTSFIYVIIVKKKSGLEKTTIQCKSEATLFLSSTEPDFLGFFKCGFEQYFLRLSEGFLSISTAFSLISSRIVCRVRKLDKWRPKEVVSLTKTINSIRGLIRNVPNGRVAVKKPFMKT